MVKVSTYVKNEMNFTFFTLGGKQFWEDVFFYQGWRIQRCVITGRYRLLDAWDIRRESGKLQKCQKAFIRYAKVYQLLSTKRKAVIFIHGFGRSKDMFKKMASQFESEGYVAAAINIPTFFKSFENIALQLDLLLENLKDIKEINFVAYGFGGLVLRKILSQSWRWKNNMRIGKVVTINVPNRGAIWAEKASHSPLLLKIFGPAIRIYDSDFIDQLPDFPSYIELGALTTRHPMGRFVSKFAPKLYRTFFPNPKDSHSATTKDVISIKTLHLNSCSAIKVITHCINFIKNGKFVSSQKIKKL